MQSELLEHRPCARVQLPGALELVLHRLQLRQDAEHRRLCLTVAAHALCDLHAAADAFVDRRRPVDDRQRVLRRGAPLLPDVSRPPRALDRLLE